MTVRFEPAKLCGTVPAVPSKSASHRALICAALANGRSVVNGLIFSEDILATIDCLKALGAEISTQDGAAIIKGIGGLSPARGQEAALNCRESGSTLRFLIPVAAALGVHASFLGSGKLPSRPITPYLDALGNQGITFHYKNTMPFSIEGGLSSGTFTLPGNISSQFITGLLFALPLLPHDSIIEITGAFESKPYVLMTLQMLEQFEIKAGLFDSVIKIPGNQQYQPCDLTVEGDFSQAAFFLTAGAFGGPVTVTGLDFRNSLQGDSQIVDFLRQAGASVTINETSVTVAQPQNGLYSPISADARDIPDLVPVLSVLAGKGNGTSVIHHAQRLKIKESDRLQTTAALLNHLDVDVKTTEDGLQIIGVSKYLNCEAESFNDHRIAMAAAVAASIADGPVLLNGAEAVRKSYPNFYEDYQALGGIVNVINME